MRRCQRKEWYDGNVAWNTTVCCVVLLCGYFYFPVFVLLCSLKEARASSGKYAGFCFPGTTLFCCHVLGGRTTVSQQHYRAYPTVEQTPNGD